MSDTDHTDELLSELRRDGVRIETDVLRRMLDEMDIMFTADDSHEMLRTYFGDWEYDEDLYGKHGVYSDRTELSTVCLTADEAVEIALGVWNENARLREKLVMEREDNASIRALFDAVAPRCGKPDCQSLVEYVEQLREMVRDMARCIRTIGEYDVFYWKPSRPGCGIDCTVNGEGCSCDGMLASARELGIEVDG